MTCADGANLVAKLLQKPESAVLEEADFGDGGIPKELKPKFRESGRSGDFLARDKAVNLIAARISASIASVAFRELFNLGYELIRAALEDLQDRSSASLENWRNTGNTVITQLQHLVPQGPASLIVDNIKEVKPDILAILEVKDGNLLIQNACPINSPLRDAGAEGSMRLLELLRFGEPDTFKNYCMIPPLKLGRSLWKVNNEWRDFDSEGIAVYYDSSKFEFIGPSRLGAQLSYGPPYLDQRNPIPDTDPVVIPGRALPNRMVRQPGNNPQEWKESRLCPNTERPAGPTPRPFGWEDRNRPSVRRRPLRAHFRFMKDAGADAYRTLKLTLLHGNLTKDHPGGRRAQSGPWQTQDIKAIEYYVNRGHPDFTVGTGEVGIIAGDLNADMNDNPIRDEIKKHIPVGYKLMLDGSEDKKRFQGTHRWRPGNWRRSFGGIFPQYGFLKSILDNVLVAGVANETKSRVFLVNRLTGTSTNYPKSFGYGNRFIAGQTDFKSKLKPEAMKYLNNLNKLSLQDLPVTDRAEVERVLKLMDDVSDHLPVVCRVNVVDV